MHDVKISCCNRLLCTDGLQTTCVCGLNIAICIDIKDENSALQYYNTTETH